MSQWQITIDSNFPAIRKASELLNTYCLQCHISPELSGQLELMLVEALNNVVEHAYQEKDGFKIEIELSDKPDSTVISITDTGLAAPNLLNNRKINLPDEDFLPEGGWGLPLIQALTDSISYSSTSDYNLLTLTKNKR